MAQSNEATKAADERTHWDEHWSGLSGHRSLFGAVARAVRVLVLNRAVRSYVERYFPPQGTFVEMGCGSGQASTLIAPRGRCVVGLDFSGRALLQARETGAHGCFLQGDISVLPFADDSLDGLWNLGVMEHFEASRGHEILGEFHRVLKPGAPLILFWPPELGSSRLVLAPLEQLRSVLSGRRFRFFPDEVNRLSSRAHGRQTLQAAGFCRVNCHLSWRDAFIHIVVVGFKP